MTEVKLKSRYPEAIKQIIKTALRERLSEITQGIKRTQSRIQEFENKYHLSTEQFIKKFNNDEINHSLDFDEWIGESRMLTHLQETQKAIEEVEFVN